VDSVCKELGHAGLAARLMIDCSHANSQKQYERQLDVAHEVAAQVAGGEDRIVGAMVESHINPGRQDLIQGQPLAYGVSITDACIGWESTVSLLRELAEAVRRRRVLLTDAA
jgi:3-deoxy-7-phosphoheptulonate synthase